MHGDGGWSTASLAPPYAWAGMAAREGRPINASSPGGDNNNPHCDVDMLDATEVTADEVLRKYILMNRPVLLRGLNADSPAWARYTKHALKAAKGGLQVHVSDIPYNQKFGSPNGKDETLEDYIDEMSARSMGDHPW